MGLGLVLLLSFHQFKSGKSFSNGWKDRLPAEGPKNVNCGSLKKTANIGMWARHRGEAGTRHWKEQKKLEHGAHGAAQRARNKGEVRTEQGHGSAAAEKGWRMQGG